MNFAPRFFNRFLMMHGVEPVRQVWVFHDACITYRVPIHAQKVYPAIVSCYSSKSSGCANSFFNGVFFRPSLEILYLVPNLGSARVITS